MICSTIIPTIGRATLERAVISVLEQNADGVDIEVIVVNDSGRPLKGGNWRRSSRVRIIETNRRERSVARNTGGCVSTGEYLHFLDDDDWMAPNAFFHLRQAMDGARKAWIYGGSQLVDRDGRPLIQLQHRLDGNCFLQVMAGEWIPLQSSWIAGQAFFEAGGFNPLLKGPEDIDLLRRIALRHDIVGTDAIVAHVVRGDQGSTTDYSLHSAQSRRAREAILDQPTAFQRLHAGVSSSPWRGRIARIYLTSAYWNLQRGRFWTACSRSLRGLAGIAGAGPRLFSRRFWRALARPYSSESFARGFAAGGSQEAMQSER